MINEAETSKEEKQEPIYLYLCDGEACSEEDKQWCYTQDLGPIGDRCRHTSDKSHSFIQKLNGLIPTKFDPLWGNDHILVEHFDYSVDAKNKIKTFLNSLIENKPENEQDNDDE